MNKKTITIGALALVLGATTLFASTSFAYRGNPDVKGPNYSEDRHAEIQKAFENKDYAAWKNLMQDRGRATQIINEDNFEKFVEAHNLALEGKIDEAQKIRQELGLGMHDGSGRDLHKNGKGFGRKGGNR